MAPGSRIEVVPLTRHIGAEIRGVDVRSLDDDTFAAIHRALMDHLVIFFRGQELTDDEHIEFAGRFGPANIYPPNRARGVFVPLEWIEDNPDSPPKADLWHTDVAFLPEPPEVAVLSMQDTPAAGGDTLWASLYGAYENLSPLLQRLLEPLAFDVHPGEDMRRKITMQFGADVFEKVEAEFSGTHQPIVRVHPVTGRRALYLCGAYIKGIVGMRQEESDALIPLLRHTVEDPNVQCRWKWQRHDLVVWDERCTNHRATGDHYPEHRLVRRCTVGASPALGVNDHHPAR
jgi:taurine dioxygenase